MLRLLNILFVDFRQAIDIVVVAFDAEILGEVDNLDVCRDGVLLEERLALTMTETEEDNVDLAKWHRVGKFQIGFPDESFMHV